MKTISTYTRSVTYCGRDPPWHLFAKHSNALFRQCTLCTLCHASCCSAILRCTSYRFSICNCRTPTSYSYCTLLSITTRLARCNVRVHACTLTPTLPCTVSRLLVFASLCREIDYSSSFPRRNPHSTSNTSHFLPLSPNGNLPSNSFHPPIAISLSHAECLSSSFLSTYSLLYWCMCRSHSLSYKAISRRKCLHSYEWIYLSHGHSSLSTLLSTWCHRAKSGYLCLPSLTPLSIHHKWLRF